MKPKIVGVLVGSGLLLGCAGASTRFYTLEPIAPAPGAAQAYGGAPFRIDAVHIPASLDRPELVRDDGGGRFTVSDDNHWAAPVGELLRRVLTQDLSARLPGGKVIYPEAPKLPGSSGLVVDILSISPSGDRVAMDASWTLVSAAGADGGHPAVWRQRTVRVTTALSGPGVEGNATTLSALAGELATAIAQDLPQPAK